MQGEQPTQQWILLRDLLEHIWDVIIIKARVTIIITIYVFGILTLKWFYVLPSSGFAYIWLPDNSSGTRASRSCSDRQLWILITLEDQSWKYPDLTYSVVAQYHLYSDHREHRLLCGQRFIRTQHLELFTLEEFRTTGDNKQHRSVRQQPNNSTRRVWALRNSRRQFFTWRKLWNRVNRLRMFVTGMLGIILVIKFVQHFIDAMTHLFAFILSLIDFTMYLVRIWIR